MLEMVAVVATMSVFEISGESGEGAACREHAGGSAHDTHSLVMNALDNYLLYSHISTI